MRRTCQTMHTTTCQSCCTHASRIVTCDLHVLPGDQPCRVNHASQRRFAAVAGNATVFSPARSVGRSPPGPVTLRLVPFRPRNLRRRNAWPAGSNPLTGRSHRHGGRCSFGSIIGIDHHHLGLPACHAPARMRRSRCTVAIIGVLGNRDWELRQGIARVSASLSLVPDGTVSPFHGCLNEKIKKAK
jgi:hypothetical protein